MDHSTNPTAADTGPTASQVAVWLALLTLYLVWGSTYLGIRFAIESIPPYVMGAFRFVLAGSVMLAWSIARNPRSRPTLVEIRDSSIVGALLLGGAMGLVAWGEQTIPSGIAALLIALLPAWLVILGRAFVGESISRPVAVGIVIGLAGVAILAGPWEAGGQFELGGLLALLASPILWATGSIFSAHRAVEPRDPIRAIAIQMLAGAVVLAMLAVLTGDLGRFEPASVTPTSVLALLYLAGIGSIVGYSTYIWLLRHAPLARIGTYAYVNPVVAFVLGALVAAEPITPRTVLAAAVIVFAVALIVTARARADRSVRAAGREAGDDRGEATTDSPRAAIPGPGTGATPASASSGAPSP